MLRYLLIILVLFCWIPKLMAADEGAPPLSGPVPEVVAEQPPSESAPPPATNTTVDNAGITMESPVEPEAVTEVADTPVVEQDTITGAGLGGDSGEIVETAEQAQAPTDTDETVTADEAALAAGEGAEAVVEEEVPAEEDALAEEELEEPLPSGGMISLTTAYGTRFSAYVVGPEDADYSVMLVHDEWGLNDDIKLRANEIAALGFRALAIDLYDGRVAYDEGLARQVRQSIDPVWADSDLRAALTYLKNKHRKVALIGWGYGAEQSLNLTLNRPEDIAATIFYYGEPIEDANALSAIQGPLFGVFANRSDKIDVEKVATFRDTMLALHKTFFMMRFDTIDGFANPLADAYNARAAGVAWQATQEFLVYSVFRY